MQPPLCRLVDGKQRMCVRVRLELSWQDKALMIWSNTAKHHCTQTHDVRLWRPVYLSQASCCQSRYHHTMHVDNNHTRKSSSTAQALLA